LGADELKRKFPDGVFASEAVSCSEEMALQYHNHQIQGRARLKLNSQTWLRFASQNPVDGDFQANICVKAAMI
jgi:hypothetical protein